MRRVVFTCPLYNYKTNGYRFFSCSAIYRSAFDYMKRCRTIFPDELVHYIEMHRVYAEKLDSASYKFFQNAISLQDIRDTYTSSALDDLIQKMVLEEVGATNQSHDELINVSRMIIKWCARQRMFERGFIDELEDIHRDNQQKCGNPIGQTPALLKQKYQGDSHAIADAAKRFRSSDDIHHQFKF